MVRVHGSVACQCPGSGQQPRNAPYTITSLFMTLQSSVHQHQKMPPSSSSIPVLHQVRVLKRIPQAYRVHAAKKLTTVLEDVYKKNSVTTWTRLWYLPRLCFRVPGRGERHWNLARQVNQQLSEDNNPTPLVNLEPIPSLPHCHANKS